MGMKPEERRNLQLLIYRLMVQEGHPFGGGGGWPRQRYLLTDRAPGLRFRGPARNWPSETTLNTNRLNGVSTYYLSFSNNPPAARRSPARNAEAQHWRTARAQTREIIERMMRHD
ncbi:hypothetical protein D3C77_48990 [compost metagenome]